MKRYVAIQVLCVPAFFVGGISLIIMLLWVIGGHGVIACGVGIFDSPTWFLDVCLVIGVPAFFMLATARLFLWSSKQIDGE